VGGALLWENLAKRRLERNYRRRRRRRRVFR
jgi:hypothetical protein